MGGWTYESEVREKSGLEIEVINIEVDSEALGMAQIFWVEKVDR